MLSRLAPLLRFIPPEPAHTLALRALAGGLVGQYSYTGAELAVEALGLRFANPIGLAAGFDKNGEALAALGRLGFGFLEVGTVTPRPQPGNPRPRLFRLPAERAAINRMGFNNAGIEALCARLTALRARSVPIGVNLGINREGADPLRDYPALVGRVVGLADYIVINVSSPNTPGLRDLQGESRLRAILGAIQTAVHDAPPLLVKLAPDLSDDGLAAIVDLALEAGIAGLVLTNTTLARPTGLRGRHASEAGGLSGPPLRARSTEMLRLAFRRAHGGLVLIGAGGVETGEDALAKIESGATLVQLYTAFAYGGPRLIPRLLAEFANALHQRGHSDVASAIGCRA